MAVVRREEAVVSREWQMTVIAPFDRSSLQNVTITLPAIHIMPFYMLVVVINGCKLMLLNAFDHY